MQSLTLSAVLNAEEDGYVALRPELDIASQGDSIEQALAITLEHARILGNRFKVKASVFLDLGDTSLKGTALSSSSLSNRRRPRPRLL
jgi:hypothetical protein